MTPKEIIQQIEHLMGRQPEGYMIRLMNDGLLEMASTKKEYTASSTTDLYIKNYVEKLCGKTNY